MTRVSEGEAEGGLGLLDRLQRPDTDDGVRLLLVDTGPVPPVTLAETVTEHVLGEPVTFTVVRAGRACVVTTNDDGEPLYHIPPPRPTVRPGDLVTVHLPDISHAPWR